jgi:hypothetical protein
MNRFFLMFALIAVTPFAFAQHDHSGAHSGHAAVQKTDTTTVSPHGGVVKNGKNLNLEIMTMAKAIAIFPLTKDGKELPLKDVVLSGRVKSSKNKSLETPVEFTAMSNHFMANIDRKGSDTLELLVEAKTAGKTEKFVFTIEH